MGLGKFLIKGGLVPESGRKNKFTQQPNKEIKMWHHTSKV